MGKSIKEQTQSNKVSQSYSHCTRSCRGVDATKRRRGNFSQLGKNLISTLHLFQLLLDIFKTQEVIFGEVKQSYAREKKSLQIYLFTIVKLLSANPSASITHLSYSPSVYLLRYRLRMSRPNSKIFSLSLTYENNTVNSQTIVSFQSFLR